MGPTLEMELEGVGAVMRYLSKFPWVYKTEVRKQEEKWARIAHAQLRRIAPRATGVYADHSIYVSGTKVWTDHPAAWRLEKGFVGVDSMGRHYTQAAQPHWSVVAEYVGREYPDDVRKMTAKFIREF